MSLYPRHQRLAARALLLLRFPFFFRGVLSRGEERWLCISCFNEATFLHHRPPGTPVRPGCRIHTAGRTGGMEGGLWRPGLGLTGAALDYCACTHTHARARAHAHGHRHTHTHTHTQVNRAIRGRRLAICSGVIIMAFKQILSFNKLAASKIRRYIGWRCIYICTRSHTYICLCLIRQTQMYACVCVCVCLCVCVFMLEA